jgi:hypothetical protein
VVNKEVEQQRKGCDIVTRETCIPTSFFEPNNLGKAAVLHFAFSRSSSGGAVPNSAYRSLSTAVLCQVLIDFSYSAPHTLLPNRRETGSPHVAPGCPQTHDLPASVFQVLGVQICTIMLARSIFC